MSLEKILDKAAFNFLPASKKRIREYVETYDLKDYFNNDNIPREEQEEMRRGLEDITEKITDKYSTELKGLRRKTITKGTMGLAVANDLSAYLTNVPFDNVTALGYTLFAAKTVAELPALKRYLQKTGDVHGWYSATKHMLLKPVRYLIPIIGPALEAGAFERMVKHRVRKEIKRNFIKKFGEYKTLEERFNNKMKEPIKNVLYGNFGQEEKRQAA